MADWSTPFKLFFIAGILLTGALVALQLGNALSFSDRAHSYTLEVYSPGDVPSLTTGTGQFWLLLLPLAAAVIVWVVTAARVARPTSNAIYVLHLIASIGWALVAAIVALCVLVIVVPDCNNLGANFTAVNMCTDDRICCHPDVAVILPNSSQPMYGCPVFMTTGCASAPTSLEPNPAFVWYIVLLIIGFAFSLVHLALGYWQGTADATGTLVLYNKMNESMFGGGINAAVPMVGSRYAPVNTGLTSVVSGMTLQTPQQAFANSKMHNV